MNKRNPSFVSKRIPLYYQLENLLRQRILSGAFAPGDQLPTENELMREYGVSQATVRQALATLAKESLIERRQGSGTFVAEQRRTAATQGSKARRVFEGEIKLTGSLGDFVAMGLGTPVELLEMQRVNADRREAAWLGVTVGAPVYRIKRRRLRGKTPYCALVNYLPDAIGARLTQRELSAGSLLQTLQKKLGLRLQEGRHYITAALADPQVAGLLEVPVGSALLSVEQTVYGADGRPVEFVHALYRSDLYHYVVHLKNEE